MTMDREQDRLRNEKLGEAFGDVEEQIMDLKHMIYVVETFRENMLSPRSADKIEGYYRFMLTMDQLNAIVFLHGQLAMVIRTMEKNYSAALMAAAAATPAAPDAELLRLDREHDVAYARSRRVGVGPDGLDDDIEEISEDMRDVELAIQSVPARALAGLAVKARLASVYFNPNAEDPPIMGIVQSLVEDILRMANATAKPSIYAPHRVEDA